MAWGGVGGRRNVAFALGHRSGMKDASVKGKGDVLWRAKETREVLETPRS